jgi:NitT/TauT family transport system substrate-binding protein
MVAACFLLPSATAYAATNMPLRVQLHWFHQAQFAGYYIAESRIAQGQGVKTIELLEGGPGIDAIEQLVNGKADIAIGWFIEAIEARRKGHKVVNVAQIFRRPGIALAFNKAAGVQKASDLVGRSVGVWNVGDEISVRLWLQREGIAKSSVQFIQQAPNAKDLISGKVQAATVMVYNEYWNLIEAGLNPNDIFMVKFSDEGFGMLEDGIYVKESSLDNDVFRRKLTRFVSATARGWKQAREHPNEALSLTMAKSPGLDLLRQRRMLNSILNLIPADKTFGVLDPAEFQRSVNIFAEHAQDPISIRRAAKGAWTHQICNDAGLGGEN